jgi:hypothetical protein
LRLILLLLEVSSCTYPLLLELKLISVVAEHFSPHTRTYQSPPTPSSLYPQHATQFNRFDNPQTEQDWTMRQAGEHRLRVMLEQAQASGATYNSCVFPTKLTDEADE